MNVLTVRKLFSFSIVAFLTGCVATEDITGSRLPLENASGSGVFYDCNGGYSFAAHINDNDSLLFLPEGRLKLRREVAQGVEQYTSGQKKFRREGGQAELNVNSRHYQCQLNRRKSIWEDARYRGADLVAMGNEPGWKLEMSLQGDIVYSGDYGMVHFRVPTPPGKQQAGVTIYQVDDGEHDMKLSIEDRPCQDDMAGDHFDATVMLQLDGRQLRGCGMVLH